MFTEKNQCYMNQIFKVTLMLLLSENYHTNNTLKILIRSDLSSTDTLLIILKVEFKLAAFFISKSIIALSFHLETL